MSALRLDFTHINTVTGTPVQAVVRKFSMNRGGVLMRR